MRIALTAIMLPIVLLALVSAAMLVLPAPNFIFFQLGIAAQEWAPWFLLVLLVGVGVLFGLAPPNGLWRLINRLTGLVAIISFFVIAGMLVRGLLTDLRVRSNQPAVVDAGAGSFRLTQFALGDAAPQGVLREQNTVYAEVAGESLLVDIYVPPTAPVNAPALVVVHGGSWRGGGKGDIPAWNRWAAVQGYVVFDISYRLAPQAQFPAAVSDVKCAIGYVRRNAERFGVDPQRLGLVGRSAGAQLALIAAYSDATIAPSCDAPDASVRAVVSYYAPTRLDYYNVIKPELAPGALDDYLGGPPEAHAEAYRQARPATWVNQNTPATLLLHGGRDQFIRPLDADVVADALAQANRPYTMIELPLANHGFDFNLHGVSNQQVQPYVMRFLAQTLQ
ncbi:alpha/beta hydrolase fold domain-containing protein [Herpetosiphon sp. NSE202]|uniref:alpha/beta hydrolase fold domain-containing protein n=1 Tax=Herpetosiphon sp. NSE202 TaxID=3351349 RepID=UPI003630CAFA